MQNKKVIYLSIGTLLINVFLITWVRVHIIHQSYTIAEKLEENKKEQEINKKLKLELEKLKSPERLKFIAETKLNLKMAGKEQLYSLPNSGRKK